MDMCSEATEVRCPFGHNFKVACPLAKSRQVQQHCTELRPVELSCGHKVFVPCNRMLKCDLRKLSEECKELVSSELSCGHEIQVPCRDRTKGTKRGLCSVVVEEALGCGHSMSRKCGEPKSCAVEVTVRLPCGHDVETTCSEKVLGTNLQRLCKERCTKTLACGHLCSGEFESSDNRLRSPHWD